MGRCGREGEAAPPPMLFTNHSKRTRQIMLKGIFSDPALVTLGVREWPLYIVTMSLRHITLCSDSR